MPAGGGRLHGGGASVASRNTGGAAADAAARGARGLRDALGATPKGIRSLSSASKGTTLLLVLVHRDRGQGGSAVNASLVVMDLVNWDSGVYDLGLNSLLVHNRLDGLVDVMVNMLALKNRSMRLRACSVSYDTLIMHPRLLSPQCPLDGGLVAVVEFPVDNLAEIALMLLGQHLLVIDGLFYSVIVVLVNLLIDGSADLFMLGGLDGLFLNGRSHTLVGGSVVVSRLGDEVVNSSLSLVHDCEWSGLIDL